MDLNTKQVRTGNADLSKMKSPAGCGASLSTKDGSKNQGSRKVSRLRRSHFERPSDSFPIDRERMVSVQPNGKGKWWALQEDSSGGSVLNCDGTKQGAIEAALEWVYRYNAEMEVINDPTGGAR
jgi:hypothetical protein